MVIQSLDLGVIVPISLVTAILLLKKRAWGYVLSTILLLKILMMGAALIAMIIGQLLAGIAVDPVTSIIFTLISLSGIILGMVTLKNVGGKHDMKSLALEHKLTDAATEQFDQYSIAEARKAWELTNLN